jgi:hypothetical protein
MHKTSLVATVLLASLIAASFCCMRSGDCGEKRNACQWPHVSLKCSPQVAWDDGVTFVMQWNDACKKMVFDGHPLSHGCRHVASCRYVCIADPVEPPLDKKDQYSFDAGSVGVPADSTASSNQDGRLHFVIEWSDSRNWFAIAEPPPAPPQEIFTFNLSGFRR